MKHIKAIDASSRMIEIARSKAEADNIRNVDFACKDVNDLSLSRASHDAVLLLNVLHLLANWRQHIAAAYQILQPGGVLVSSTMCMSDNFAYMRIPATAGRIFGLLPYLCFFTRRDLEYVLVNVGFKIRYAWQPASNRAVFLVARKPTC